ncbi:hypothetical protein [Metallibacterium scheffleri]|nr:hypothetical protein [Metallibacterium scheffleri]
MGASASREEFQKQSAVNMLDLLQLITFSSAPRNIDTNDNGNGTRIFVFAAKDSCFQLIKNAMSHKAFETEWPGYRSTQNRLAIGNIHGYAVAVNEQKDADRDDGDADYFVRFKYPVDGPCSPSDFKTLIDMEAEDAVMDAFECTPAFASEQLIEMLNEQIVTRDQLAKLLAKYPSPDSTVVVDARMMALSKAKEGLTFAEFCDDTVVIEGKNPHDDATARIVQQAQSDGARLMRLSELTRYFGSKPTL